MVKNGKLFENYLGAKMEKDLMADWMGRCYERGEGVLGWSLPYSKDGLGLLTKIRTKKGHKIWWGDAEFGFGLSEVDIFA